MRRIILSTAVLAIAVAVTSVAPAAASTVVPGQQGRDGVVVGKYTSVYSYDAAGDWYWDLGDGRTRGTVASADELDQATLTACKYQVVYRGDFGGDPFLDEGWTINNIVCRGYEKTATFHYRDNWGGDYPQFR